MPIEYFEDVELHQKHRSREFYLTEKDIIAFAKEWDPQPFHIDPESAKNSTFGGLIASGVHLVVIGQKLLNERMPKSAYIAGLALDDFKWLAPARPGDVIVLEMEAISKRESKSNRNAGIVRYIYKLFNQRGEELLAYKGTAMTQKRYQS
jgi:acyl dehydratase